LQHSKIPISAKPEEIASSAIGTYWSGVG
jgi:hypothetical protein